MNNKSNNNKKIDLTYFLSLLVVLSKMHIDPKEVYYIDCPVNTPVYTIDNRLIGYTDGYKARPTNLSSGSICLSLEPMKECSRCKDDNAEYNFPDLKSEFCYSCSDVEMVNTKQFIWITGTGVYVVGIGIKLSDDLEISETSFYK